MDVDRVAAPIKQIHEGGRGRTRQLVLRKTDGVNAHHAVRLYEEKNVAGRSLRPGVLVSIDDLGRVVLERRSELRANAGVVQRSYRRQLG